jgi:hypothetical protein
MIYSSLQNISKSQEKEWWKINRRPSTFSTSQTLLDNLNICLVDTGIVNRLHNRFGCERAFGAGRVV